MNDQRPYIIEVSEQMTRFILPKRRPTLWHIGSATLLFLAGMLLLTLAVYVVTRSITGGVWLGFLGFACLKYAISTINRSHGELIVNAKTDDLRVTNQALSSAAWNFFELSEIQRLEIDAPESTGLLLQFKSEVLSLEFADGTRHALAQEYPRPLLEQLAADLQPLIQSAKSHVLELPQQVSIIDVSSIPPTSRDVLEQPSSSKIVTTHSDGVHTFII